MKNSSKKYLRRMAAASVVSGFMAWSSAMCYTQNSYDDASDPEYADGWQEGDNGGTGFTPWNFDSSYFWTGDGNWYPHSNPEFHAIDDGLQKGTHYSNPFNGVGRAWAMGIAPDNPDGEARAGRGFSPLEIGDTLNVIIDNPTDREFFKGYYVRLNGGTGGVNGNICLEAGASCTPMATPPARKMYFSRLEHLDDGEWGIVDADDLGPPVFDFTFTGVFDSHTAGAGALFSVTRTGTDTYDVLLDPIGPGPSFSNPTPFPFSNPGVPIDWIEFTFFNPTTDIGTSPTTATDLYIKSIEIIRAAPPGQPGGFNEDGTVDAADYVVWRKTGINGSTGYGTWRTNFGQPGDSGSGANATAPEPVTLVMLMFAAVGWCLRRSPAA